MSDISDTTVKVKSLKGSQRILSSVPNAINSEFRLIHALAGRLGKLVEWRKVKLADGRAGWILFFDAAKWEVATNGNTNELSPR